MNSARPSKVSVRGETLEVLSSSSAKFQPLETHAYSSQIRGRESRSVSNEEDTQTRDTRSPYDPRPYLCACVNGKQEKKNRKTNICYHIQPSKRELSCAIASVSAYNECSVLVFSAKDFLSRGPFCIFLRTTGLGLNSADSCN